MIFQVVHKLQLAGFTTNDTNGADNSRGKNDFLHF